MMRSAKIWLLLVVVLAVVPDFAKAEKTYFADAPMDYSTGDCNPGAKDVLEHLGQMLWRMQLDGWTGSYYGYQGAWPADWQDMVVYSKGEDHTYADTKLMSIFDGHGGIFSTLGYFSFSHRAKGDCQVDYSSQMRLGTGHPYGDRSAYLVLSACCTMNTRVIGQLWPNEVHEMFGFHSQAIAGWDMFEDWYLDTVGVGVEYSNFYSWLNNMEDRRGIADGINSPVSVSFGTSADEAYYKAVNCKFRHGTCLYQAAEPQDWVYWELIDNGEWGCGY